MNILVVEYPGYGVYKNLSPNEERICSDALYVYDFLVEKMKFKPKNIMVFGRSLGSVPATYLSAN